MSPEEHYHVLFTAYQTAPKEQLEHVHLYVTANFSQEDSPWERKFRAVHQVTGESDTAGSKSF